MANKYGEAALIAARQSQAPGIDPALQWQHAMETLYPTSVTARRKSSPRGAFLGLCEEGLVRGIPAGHYAATRDNKAYAVHAVALLAEAAKSWSTGSLWKAVTHPADVAHRSQMDVVLALWKNGWIVPR